MTESPHVSDGEARRIAEHYDHQHTLLGGLARDLLNARQLLRDIKQNIDFNGPDRPDLYARITEIVDGNQ